MSPAAREKIGDQKYLPTTPFLTKTYQLVEDPSMDEVISWNDDGTSFVVWSPAEFARDVLPKYFKHNNFSSFVRQLNTYGFRKIGPDRWEFTNDFFRRGEKCLLRNIQRRKLSSPATPGSVTVAVPLSVVITQSNSGEEQTLSSSSSPATTAAPPSNLTSETSSDDRDAIADENDRLRKENLELKREISHMKSLCKNIYALMSSYGTNSGIPIIEKPLDLLGKQFNGEPEEVEMYPKLFGVSIGVKRVREESEAATSDHDYFLQQQQPVNSEPIDCDEKIVELHLG